MRISGNHKDPDYWRNRFKVCPDVFLDGILRHHVVEADTAKGFIVVEIWRDRKPVLDDDCKRIAQWRVDGKVSIVDRSPGAWPEAANLVSPNQEKRS